MLSVDVAVGYLISLSNELKFRILVIESRVSDAPVSEGNCGHLAVECLVFVSSFLLVVALEGTGSSEQTEDSCLPLLRQIVDPDIEDHHLRPDASKNIQSHWTPVHQRYDLGTEPTSCGNTVDSSESYSLSVATHPSICTNLMGSQAAEEYVLLRPSRSKLPSGDSASSSLQKTDIHGYQSPRAENRNSSMRRTHPDLPV